MAESVNLGVGSCAILALEEWRISLPGHLTILPVPCLSEMAVGAGSVF